MIRRGKAAALVLLVLAASLVAQPPPGGPGPLPAALPMVAAARSAGVAADEVAAGDPIAGPFVDVAALAGEQPRLVVARSADGDRPASVAMVERADAGWHAGPSLELAAPGSEIAAGPPWLIGPLPDGRSLLVLRVRAYETVVDVVEVAGDTIGPTGQSTLPIAADRATLGDVDGDGTSELLVASSSADPPCGVTRLVSYSLDGSVLRQRSEHHHRGLSAATLTLGEFDARPGVDVAAMVDPSCPGAPDGRATVRFVRLADGGAIAEAATGVGGTPVSPGTLLPSGPAGPIPTALLLEHAGVLYLVRPGRAVPLLRGIDVLGGVPTRTSTDELQGAPHDGWRLTLLDGASDPELVAVAVERDGSMRELGRSPALERSERLAFARELVRTRPTESRWSALAADVDGDGCGELVTALVIARPGGCGAALAAGPAWIGTTPLRAYAAAGARQLLVAATLDWAKGPVAVPQPAPAATAAWGGWRAVPALSFALSEFPAADLRTWSRFPIVRRALRAPRLAPSSIPVEVTGPAGARVFLLAEGPQERSDIDFRRVQPAEIFRAHDAALAARRWFVTRVHRTPGSPSGRAFGTIAVAVDLPVRGPTGPADPRAPARPPAPPDDQVETWMIRMVMLNDLGQPGIPDQMSVNVDAVAPSVAIETPAMSVPWPLETRLTITAEPFTEVAVADRPPVSVGPSGHTSVAVPLLPWPHRIDVTARDRAGNTTTVGVMTMGGVDLVRASWELWLLVAVALVLLGWRLRATRHRRRIMPSPPAGATGGSAIDDLGHAGPGIEKVRRSRTVFRQPPR